MTPTCIDIFTDSELDRLAEGALTVLERTGIVYQSEVALDALAANGAAVDKSSQHARLPRRMVEEVIESQVRRQSQSVAAAQSQREAAAHEQPLPGLHGQVAQFYYDHGRSERRPGSRAELLRMIRFGEELDRRCSVNHVLLMREEPPAVEALEALLMLLEHSSRPGKAYPHFAAQFPYFEEIGEIYAGDAKRFLARLVFMVSPLRMDRRACDFMVGIVRRGMSCGIGTQPVSGVSAPVTRAGAIVLAAAEILGGWTAAAALDPDQSLAGCVCSGSLDMAAANASFCSPEAMIQDIGCVELFRRRWGGGVSVAGVADYTSAKLPGYQAGFEKAFEAMAVSAYTGHYPELGAGLLDSGKMFSPLQLLLDRELQSFLWRFDAGAAVNDDEMALNLISEIGSGLGRSYLESEHTLAHYRRTLWFANLLDRSVWQGDQQERPPDERLLARAAAQFNEILARYHPPAVDRDVLAKVRGVVASARRQLVESAS